MAPPIKLFLSDVDGTLVTPHKTLTERTIAAVRQLKKAGILFAVTSGRPPRGMSMLVDPLKLTTPIAAFNGGIFANPDMTVIEHRAADRAGRRHPAGDRPVPGAQARCLGVPGIGMVRA